MKKFFKSIKFKIFASVTALMAATVLLCVCLNSVFGQKYYFFQTKKNLLTSYAKICELYNSSDLSDIRRATEIEKLSTNYNFHIMIFNDDGPVYSSLPKDSERFSNGKAAVPREDRDIPEEPPSPNAKNADEKNAEDTYSNDKEKNRRASEPRFFTNREIMDETDDYRIFSSYIANLDAYNIEFAGDINNNLRVVIQSSAAAISEATAVYNRFFIFTGLIALIIAGFFAYLISLRITKPIFKLSTIAKSMSELDFSKKYESNSNDELGHLGKSINTLSEKLEISINDLKEANLRLLEDIKQKEKIDKQRRDFLSNVSHELKTPISIIEAYADGLLEMELSESDRRYYSEVIADETEKMGIMIKKLMALMQLESKKLPAEPEKYDIKEQINNIISVKTPLISQCGANVMFNAPEETIFVYADSFLIEEALNNYLTNAMKYSSGDKRIVFSLEDKTDKIRINVFNSGSHIQDEEIEYIWNSFYMTDKARTRDGTSCGLGLSIVKAIADAHKSLCGAYNTDDGIVFFIEVEKA